MEYHRKLVLEDGAEYYGTGFGYAGDAVCEIVFNTSMVGYQEIISDPSYTDQAVVMTYPLIGNYGTADEDYETNTGNVIVETFAERKLNPIHVPAVVCRNHGPFTFGKDAAQAVYHAVVLEEVSRMAMFTESINPKVGPAPACILDKHFMRKHGPNAYYGQGGAH